MSRSKDDHRVLQELHQAAPDTVDVGVLGLGVIRSPSVSFLGQVDGATRDPSSLITGRKGGSPFDDLEGEPLLLATDEHLIARFERTGEDHAGELVVHPPLDGAAQGARPKLRVEAFLGDEFYRFVCELDLYVLSPQAPRSPLKK